MVVLMVVVATIANGEHIVKGATGGHGEGISRDEHGWWDAVRCAIVGRQGSEESPLKCGRHVVPLDSLGGVTKKNF
jgi:hypothetical protein